LKRSGRGPLASCLLPLTLAACGCHNPSATADWTGNACARVVLDETGGGPDRILLTQGQPVRLHLVNPSLTTRSFAAPRFFATVAPAAGSGLLPIAGRVEIPPGGSRDLVFVPVLTGTWPVVGGRPRRTPFDPPTTIVVVPAPG
jgi:hypothetical protein